MLPVSNLVAGVRVASWLALPSSIEHIPVGLENSMNLVLIHSGPMMQAKVLVLESSR
jgi:hypothetical protein